jgi:uncharacterized membrane protein YuzA (DUF378 family)
MSIQFVWERIAYALVGVAVIWYGIINCWQGLYAGLSLV